MTKVEGKVLQVGKWLEVMTDVKRDDMRTQEAKISTRHESLTCSTK